VEELEQFCRVVYKSQDLSRSRLSSLLKAQLFVLHQYGDHVHWIRQAIHDVDKNEVQSAGMKRDSQFEDPPLRGLWKKHVYDPAYEPLNIRNELTNSGSKTSEQIDELFALHRGERFPDIRDAFINLIATKPISNRQEMNELTGEWLIYARHEDFNYVLSLAGHKEGVNRREGDQRIFDRIYKSCSAEFPFLFSVEGGGK
jgi:hypothetical protein